MTAGNLERFSVRDDAGAELATAPTFAAARRAAEVLLEEEQADALTVTGPRYGYGPDVELGRWTITDTGAILRRF